MRVILNRQEWAELATIDGSLGGKGTEPANAAAKQAGRFAPGQSGNPAGKAKGTRHRTTLAVEALLEGEAEALTRKAIVMALQGDGPAMRLCLERLAPPRKDRPLTFDLPPIETAADAAKASGAILAAVASGDITPAEGSEVGKLVESFVRALEVSEIEERLRRLEAATA